MSGQSTVRQTGPDGSAGSAGQFELLREAEACAVALPHGPEGTGIRALLVAFRFKFAPEMLLDVALVKAILDRPEAARVSRFSAAGAA